MNKSTARLLKTVGFTAAGAVASKYVAETATSHLPEVPGIEKTTLAQVLTASAGFVLGNTSIGKGLISDSAVRSSLSVGVMSQPVTEIAQTYLPKGGAKDGATSGYITSRMTDRPALPPAPRPASRPASLANYVVGDDDDLYDDSQYVLA